MLQRQPLATHPLQGTRDLHHADVVAVVCDAVVVARLCNEHLVTGMQARCQGPDAIHKQGQLPTTLPVKGVRGDSQQC